MITLRPDQEQVYSEIRDRMRRFQSIVVQCPTGWGKTALAAVIAQGVYAKRNKVIFSVHRKQLIRQTVNTFNMIGLPHGIIAAGIQGNPFESVQIASIDTLRNRLSKYRADLLVVDEAHLAAAPTWKRCINHYRNQGARILLLTATPTRLDGKPLSALADNIVTGPRVRWLIDRGLLSDYRAFAPSMPAFDQLHTRYGDYITKEVEDLIDRPSITGDAIEAWKRHAPGKRTIAFAVSRNHGRHLLEAYNTAGIPAVYMDGETKDSERQQLISQFANGEAKVLINIQLCTEGFDLSAQIGRDVPIEAGAFLRPTQSLALAMQMVGRCLRRKKEPAILMDHVNLFRTHGLPDDDREWTLEGRTKKDKKGDDGDNPPSIVLCQECFAYFRPRTHCPECGAIRVIQGRQVTEREGELTEYEISDLREHNKRVSKAIKMRELRDSRAPLSAWEALGREYGHKRGWAWHQHRMQGKYGKKSHKTAT